MAAARQPQGIRKILFAPTHHSSLHTCRPPSSLGQSQLASFLDASCGMGEGRGHAVRPPFAALERGWGSNCCGATATPPKHLICQSAVKCHINVNDVNDKRSTGTCPIRAPRGGCGCFLQLAGAPTPTNQPTRAVHGGIHPSLGSAGAGNGMVGGDGGQGGCTTHP